MSLTARPAREVPTLWLNPDTGELLTPDGRQGPALSGPASLVDALDAASRHKAHRIMIAAAAMPRASWVLETSASWELHSCNVAGIWWARYKHRATEEDIWVRCIHEWGTEWAEMPLEAARAAFERLAALVSTLDRDHPVGGPQVGKNRAPLMLSPEATGLNLWALTVPDQVPHEPLPADMAEELRASLAPARNDYVVQGPKTYDGYASDITAGEPNGHLHTLQLVLPEVLECNELGIGPATRLTAAEAAAQFTQSSYHPARYRVRFRVPDHWTGPGLLALQEGGGWRWPNRPGTEGTTWAGQAELRLATTHGWATADSITEAIRFTHSIPSTRGQGKMTRPRPLDGWARVLRTLWDAAATGPAPEALQAALSRIVTGTIDAFANTVERSAISTTKPATGIARAVGNGLYAVQETAAERPSSMRHPEFTAQIRAGAAARFLDGPNGGGERIGALHLPGRYWGARGSILVTEKIPAWIGDEHRAGRWSVKASSDVPTAPATLLQAIQQTQQ